MVDITKKVIQNEGKKEGRTERKKELKHRDDQSFKIKFIPNKSLKSLRETRWAGAYKN